MATPEPSTDLPATFMSSGKKAKKLKESPRIAESSDPEAPPKAFNKKKKKEQKKKTPTSKKAMDLTAAGSSNEMAAEREVVPTLNSSEFVHDLNEYAGPGADASSEVDVTYHEALQEHTIDPALIMEEIGQESFLDEIMADHVKNRAPTAVMGFNDEHETSETLEQNVSTSSTVHGHVVDSETHPTTPPKGVWKRLPMKTTGMFRKVDLLNENLAGSGDDEASVDDEPVVETAKTRKRGRPSKIDKLAERNAKKAKTQADKDAIQVPATRHSLRSRSVKDQPASAPARPRGRPSKTSARPQAVETVEGQIKHHHALHSQSEKTKPPVAAIPRGRPGKVVKFTTESAEEQASKPAGVRGRPFKKGAVSPTKEDSARPLSPMRAARKAAKNAPAAAKGGPMTRTRSQELKALIGKSSLRSAAKQESLKNLKNGRDAWKKEKKSSKAKAAKAKKSKVAPKALETSKPESKHTVKIGSGITKRRKRRGVCWTNKKSKKGKTAHDTSVNKKPMVQVIIDAVDFDRSEFTVYDE
ncbi:hypothetical protein MBLNU457_5498t1 [Dothideomycetes sp. NU457]